jgi:hypothetical protein
MKNKTVLDACCGGRMCWFDKNNSNVLFIDNRKEEHVLCDGRSFTISPDRIVDFTNMPFKDCSFKLILFDPPHAKTFGKTSWNTKKYGMLNENWKETINKGFSECWRVLDYNGTLIFKWSDVDIKLKEVLSCFKIKPLFGHTTTRNLRTHWLVFFKDLTGNAGERERRNESFSGL